MESVMSVLSKFKTNLGNIINNYRDKIVEIEKEEEFINVLGDLVNYSKSDCLLLPFYDITILSRVFERVFPLSNNEIGKIKTAKYLIEASRDIDRSQFLQYNNAVQDLSVINNKIIDYYNGLLLNNNLSNEKENYSILIDKYTKIFDIIGEEEFIGLIDDIDLFHDVVMISNLSIEEIDLILDVAIKDNLRFLDNTGVISTEVDDEILIMKEKNNKMQEAINDLSNLLDASV